MIIFRWWKFWNVIDFFEAASSASHRHLLKIYRECLEELECLKCWNARMLECANASQARKMPHDQPRPIRVRRAWVCKVISNLNSRHFVEEFTLTEYLSIYRNKWIGRYFGGNFAKCLETDFSWIMYCCWNVGSWPGPLLRGDIVNIWWCLETDWRMWTILWRENTLEKQ